MLPIARSRPRKGRGKREPATQRIKKCPAPPVSTRTSKPLPCSFLAGHVGRFYLGPTPSLQRLKHLATKPGTGHHAGGYRPSRFSFGLCLTAHVGKRCYPRSRAVCAAFRHAILTPRHWPRAFSLRIQKISLPCPPPGCPGSGRIGLFPGSATRLPPDSLGSPLGPFLVELFPALFPGTPEPVKLRCRASPHRQVPSQAALHRPEGFRPRRRDLHPLRTEAAPQANARGTFQRRPHSGSQNYRIERRDYSAQEPLLPYRGSWRQAGLDRRASVEPDKPLARHPALPAQHVDGR